MLLAKVPRRLASARERRVRCRPAMRTRSLKALWLMLLAGAGASGCTRNLHDRLWDAVNDEMTQGKAAPMDDARPQIAQLVDKGTAQVDADPTKGKPDQAEANIRKLVKTMILNAATGGSQQTRGVTEVHSKDVDAAANKVCPLYPFC